MRHVNKTTSRVHKCYKTLVGTWKS